MSTFKQRLNQLGERFDEVNGETITYDDGSNSGEITASPILMQAEEIIPDVAVTRMEYLLWGIQLDELQDIVGDGVLPQIGDKITRSTGEEFRLVSFGGDEPPYKYATNTRERVLCFAQLIKHAD